jgi:hypothetical protein
MPPGAEILISYGTEYWTEMRKIKRTGAQIEF